MANEKQGVVKRGGSQAGDDEMLKWLDVLLEFDPAGDVEIVEIVEASDDFEMHEADGSEAFEDDDLPNETEEK